MYKKLTRAEGGRVLSKSNSKWGKDKISGILKKRGAKIHFVGVGGVGMYSLFTLSERFGFCVSGSDRERSRLTDSLISAGKDVKIGHCAENADGKDLLVYTLAISEDNPETVRGGERGTPCVSRAEYLGALMEKYIIRIGVSGTHGKSTSCAMLDRIFCSAGKNPTTLCGASLPEISLPVRVGGEKYFIYEGCEYKDSFLRFSPTVSVFTNLELDHVDYFNNIEEIKSSFLKAMDLSGTAVINIDDENLYSLFSKTKSNVVTFGEREDSNYRYSVIGNRGGFYSFEVFKKDKSVLKCDLAVAGKHNVKNAVGAAAAALEVGIPGEVIEDALSSFSGIERRMERIGSFGNSDVYYDYAHHPTEIECAVNTVKEITGKSVTVIFKPHTYSRTAGLMTDFVGALSLADKVLLCDISAIREAEIPGVNSSRLAEMIGNKAKKISEEEIIEELSCADNGAIIIMGAANLDTVKEKIIGK